MWIDSTKLAVDRQLAARRAFLGGCGAAATSFALAPLGTRLAMAAELGDAHILAPRPSHFPPRAKHLIMIFLTGGFAHVDTFDEKPQLRKDHGKEVATKDLMQAVKAPLMASIYNFQRCGKSGLSISELFPHLQTVADELCVIRSMHTDILEHFQATLAMHTGSSTVPLPSIGAWLSYGLGTLNANLPSYVLFAAELPYAGAQVLSNSFLPPQHQGVRIVPGVEPIPNLAATAPSATIGELENEMLDWLNRKHADLRPEDLDLRARIASYGTARGMMQLAPRIFDLGDEPVHVLEAYGVASGDRSSFGAQCLMARRLIEQGVRVVELMDSGSDSSKNWDAHGNMADHRRNARLVDQSIAALIADMRRRGSLDDTLIAICTEFGRTPWRQHTGTEPGRNHWNEAFTCLLAGAGIKGGITYGATDEYGWHIAENPCHVHDYHATILHLLGIDHKQLTYRHAGRDFRLTDVHGRVIQDLLS